MQRSYLFRFIVNFLLLIITRIKFFLSFLDTNLSDLCVGDCRMMLGSIIEPNIVNFLCFFLYGKVKDFNYFIIYWEMNLYVETILLSFWCKRESRYFKKILYVDLVIVWNNRCNWGCITEKYTFSGSF